MKKLQKLKNFAHQPCSYPEYTSQLQQDVTDGIKLTNRFEALSEIDTENPTLGAVESSMSLDIDEFASNGKHLEISDGSDSDSTDTEMDDWEEVLYKKPGKMTLFCVAQMDDCAKMLKETN